jgi:hypothetical protein
MAATDDTMGDVPMPASSGQAELRLPAGNGNRRLLGSLAGSVIARPWLDRATLFALKHAFFPLSRLWAAAGEAHGNSDAFWAASLMPRRHEHRDKLEIVLARYEEAAVTSAATDAAWHDVFFRPLLPLPLAEKGRRGGSPATRVALETARHNRRNELNLMRRHFLFLLNRSVPRVKLDIRSPDEVEDLYPVVADVGRYFAPPSTMPIVEMSQSVPGVGGTDYWLRFASPSERLGDMVYARVHTPIGVTNPPTVILGHGVCVDFDHWHGLIDETHTLLAAGIRVIRPEAPWHGRRAPSGYFGGERAIGTYPTGMLDLLTGSIREWAVLADWARNTSTGPLAFGGTSLGALTAQLAASVAHDWPERLKPQAIYLMTHSGHMADAMMSGAISTLFADPTLAQAKGWNENNAERLLALIDPVGSPVMPPSRIVSVLGSRDVITPFAGGKALVERWVLPPENVFISNNGHFTIPMRLTRHHAPTNRFIEIVKGL